MNTYSHSKAYLILTMLWIVSCVEVPTVSEIEMCMQDDDSYFIYDQDCKPSLKLLSIETHPELTTTFLIDSGYQLKPDNNYHGLSYIRRTTSLNDRRLQHISYSIVKIKAIDASLMNTNIEARHMYYEDELTCLFVVDNIIIATSRLTTNLALEYSSSYPGFCLNMSHSKLRTRK